jgi:hypothetical protein
VVVGVRARRMTRRRVRCSAWLGHCGMFCSVVIPVPLEAPLLVEVDIDDGPCLWMRIRPLALLGKDGLRSTENLLHLGCRHPEMKPLEQNEIKGRTVKLRDDPDLTTQDQRRAGAAQRLHGRRWYESRRCDAEACSLQRMVRRRG